MIRDIKKYNVWIVYVCMWLFSFFTVWYIAIVMYYTLVHVTQSGYASDFIKNISTLSNVPIRSFYIAVFGFIGLFCFVSIRKKIRFFSHHQIIPILIELGLSLLIMKNISFSATCILFLIIADSLLYVDKPVDRSICIILVFLAYMLSNYGYLSNYIPMISFQEYLSVYNSKTQGLLLGIEATLSNLNIVLFIAYIFLYLQKQMDETQKFAALNVELKRLNNQLKGYANLREKMGETKERNRLAREIHDTLGHTLTGLSVGLEACRVMIDKDVNVTKAQLGILEESAKRGLTDVRRSVDKLKPDALERMSLNNAIHQMIEDMSKVTNTKIYFVSYMEELEFEADEEEVIYRIIQESTTNAIRHGKATEIWIRISEKDEELMIIISDNGCGCESIKEGFGLKHIRERVELLNGEVNYQGMIGFTIIAKIPIRNKLTGKKDRDELNNLADNNDKAKDSQ